MKRSNFLICMLLLGLTHQVHAQQLVPELFKKKIKGTIIMKDGTKLTGEFRTPKIKEKTIKYFGAGEEKKEIASEAIKMLKIPNKNNGFSNLIYTDIGAYFPPFTTKKDVKLKKKKNKFWLLEYESGKKVNLYIAGTRYKQKSDGNIYAFADGNRNNPGAFLYYAQMKGRDEYPILLDSSAPGNYYFKNNGYWFFKGKDNVLSDKIKNKEKDYKSKNMLQVIRDYNNG